MPIKKPTKYFDNDTRPVAPLPAATSVDIKPISRRRRYAHDFSAGRQLKRITNAKGITVWRRVPDAAIVFYGKQLSHRKSKMTNAVGKDTYAYKKEE
jgi:hypothetical protein